MLILLLVLLLVLLLSCIMELGDGFKFKWGDDADRDDDELLADF